MRNQAKLVAKASVESKDDIIMAVETLKTTTSDLGGSAAQTVVKIKDVQDELSKESKRLLSVSSEVMQNTEEATSNFTRQSDILYQVIEESQSRVDEINKSGLRHQRETFLGSAKFIIESLHSISVDLTRGLDGEISEKMWKAFKKGDTSVFTRKLNDLGTSVSYQKINEKFVADGEFRSYVKKFLQSFEELYGQAASQDHGALLSTTLASSDVGRLYQMLCSAIGHEDKISRQKAA
jgi:hypothetical protein